jgi:hypothetical protein
MFGPAVIVHHSGGRVDNLAGSIDQLSTRFRIRLEQVRAGFLLERAKLLDARAQIALFK